MAEPINSLGSSPAEIRDQIIAQLVAALEPMGIVAAAWLEGADGRGVVDEHSDIDLVLAAEDGAEDRVFAAVEQALSGIAEIDQSYQESGGAAGLQHRVYHLAGTHPVLLIDVVIQSRSRQFAFDPEHPDEVPLPLFDKAGVIRFEAPETSVFAEQRARAWNDAKQRFLPEARVKRYVHRDRYLEGMAAYHKYVLSPLLELLRLKHEPSTSGYGLVHVSDHLPTGVVARLENLYRVGSVEELAQKLSEARRWFDEIVNDFRTRHGGENGMGTESERGEEYTKYHKDGSVWAKGRMIDGVATGYWEWFRKDGTKLRSGHFEVGEPVGEWITYDRKGQEYKVTQMKPKGGR